jgi:hypothetical protein
MNIMEKWFLVTTKNDLFGLGINMVEKKVIFAPERHKWMIGKSVDEVSGWINENKTGKIELTSEGKDYIFPLIISKR